MPDFTYDDTSSQNDLINEVEYHADRVTPTQQSVGLNREAVYNQLVKAMRQILHVAPRRAIDAVAADGTGQSATNTNGRTEVPLPEDFARFMRLRLASWERDVYETIDPRSDQHRLQYNSNTQADVYNPVIAKVATPGAASGRSLFCYPEGEAPTLDAFAYVPEMAPEEIPSILQEATILQATSYVLAAEKEAGAETAQAIANQLLQQIKVGEQPMVQRAYQEVEDS